MPQEADKERTISIYSPKYGFLEPETLKRQLELSEERYRTMVELAREGIIFLDPQARITFTNTCLADMLGYRPEEMLGRSVFDFMDREAQKLVQAQLERRRRGLSDIYELSMQQKDSSPLPCLIAAAPLMIEDKFLGSLAVVTDISQLKEGERELRAAKEFRDTIINTITDNLVVIDPQTCRLELANASFLARMNLETEAAVGRPCYEVMHARSGPCRAEGFYCPVQETARLKRPVLSDKNFLDSQGREHIYQIAAYPHFDDQGNVDLVICLEREVTDRRRMEEALAFRSQELQKTQLQLEKLSEISRERTAKRSVPELVFFLHGKLREAFPESDPIFFLLDPGQNHFLPLDEGPGQVTEPLRRIVRRLEQAGLIKTFINYINGLDEKQTVSFAERTMLPPFLRIISDIYPSWFGLPVYAKQYPLGFFILGSLLHQAYAREDVYFCQALLAQVTCYLRYLSRQEGQPVSRAAPLPEKTAYGDIIGHSKKMQEVYGFIDLLSGTDATVLITGDNGTGKELVARTIHRQSKRGRGPFVVANCSAYSPTLLESELFGHEKGAFTGAIRRKKGRFELADGGTLFLDEIGDIPPATQVLLLRFLQDHCFERVGGEATIESEVRVLAATNKDLYQEVQAGRFRDDLYYRLNVITVHLPPLRDRKEDIPLLCQHFLNKYNLKEGKKIVKFTPEAMQTLMDYDWPGNVRQLENAVSHAVILAPGEMIRRRHLPRFLKEAAEEARPTTLAEGERRLILRVLQETQWNKHEAARRLQVSRSTLYSKIKRYGVEQPVIRNQ